MIFLSLKRASAIILQTLLKKTTWQQTKNIISSFKKQLKQLKVKSIILQMYIC